MCEGEKKKAPTGVGGWGVGSRGWGWGLTEHICYLLFYRARWAWFYHFLFLEYNQQLR